MSLNPTPVNATVEFGFVIVNISWDVAPTAMLVGLNAFEMVGGDNTVSVAVLLVAPVPPSFELTPLVVLSFTPAVVPVTSTFTVQVPLGPSVAPLKVSVVSPGNGVKVPPQLELALGVPATCNPDGSESVKPTPVSVVVVFGLVSVRLTVAIPPSGIVATTAVAVPPPDDANPELSV